MPFPTLRFDFPVPYAFADPVREITADTLADVRPALRAVQQAAEAGFYAGGFVAYEAAPAFDPAFRIPPPIAGLPLVWFGVFPAPSSLSCQETGEEPPARWLPDTDAAGHARALGMIREAIAAGEVYQVNHTFRLRAEGVRTGEKLYSQWRAASGARYSAFLDLGRFQILSASPELFFHRLGARLVTRPMKGTRRRGRWKEEDAEIASALAASEKDQAENVMIVDLLRNDLGRIAVPGTVRVPALFETERYPTLWQMTSTVEAELPEGRGLEQIFAALFPCGSVTGAPKISAMQRIAALEESPRGIYCGSVGYVLPGGEALFNVAIRTALADTRSRKAVYGVGGGIVWDSQPDAEYREALSKAAILTAPPPAFELLETLRWEKGAYVLRERHLARILASADYFAFPADRAALEAALDREAAGAGDTARRVRLRLGRDGAIVTESGPLTPLPALPVTAALAKSPVSGQDPFLCHKTTHRAVYDRHRQAHPAAFDVLLWNEDGELTEFTIGNLMLERDGRLWTPPRGCGLLTGTLRAEMLAQDRVHERILRPADLDAADALWLVNSVRGMVPVQMAGAG